MKTKTQRKRSPAKRVSLPQLSAECPRYAPCPVLRTAQRELDEIEAALCITVRRIKDLPVHGYFSEQYAECRGIAERLQSECDGVLSELRGML